MNCAAASGLTTAINTASDVYISTITQTQIGGKVVFTMGDVVIHTTRAATFTISLYGNGSLLRTFDLITVANQDVQANLNWFSAASTAGVVNYSLRIHSNQTGTTQTVTGYSWRVMEE